MSSQTVYFSNPTVINNLQQSNNWSRGQLVSADLVYTVAANSCTGALISTIGPAQDINVYKVIYYSSNSAYSTTVERVSGTMYVPETVSKTGVLSYARATIFNTSDSELGYNLFPSATWNALTPEQRGVLPLEAIGQMITAGKGYITLVADGFGLGVSQNKIPYTQYYTEINPQVDLLRAFKSLVVSNDSRLNGATYPPSLPILQYGYSLGGIFSPCIANEFQPGVSSTITPTEADGFSFQRIVLGAPVAVVPYLDFIRDNAPSDNSKYIVNTLWSYVLPLSLAGNPVMQAATAKPSAIGNILQVYNQDFTNSTSDLLNEVIQGYAYDYTLNASQYISEGIAIPFQNGMTGMDVRQLCYTTGPNSIFNFSSLFQNYSMANNLRPLYSLQNIPITAVYSNQDELILPLFNASSTGVDFGNYWDRYMSTGVVGTGFSYTGAGKTINVDIDTKIAGVNDIPAVPLAILNQSGNTYNRFRINTQYLPSGISNHSGFGFYYYVYVNLTL